jgi:hypothetical protein
MSTASHPKGAARSRQKTIACTIVATRLDYCNALLHSSLSSAIYELERRTPKAPARVYYQGQSMHGPLYAVTPVFALANQVRQRLSASNANSRCSHSRRLLKTILHRTVFGYIKSWGQTERFRSLITFYGAIHNLLID